MHRKRKQNIHQIHQIHPMAFPGSLVQSWRQLRRWLPPCNFITIHYTYFVVTCLVTSVIFWGASTPAHSVRFIDALFLVVSAMTLSGLGSINLSTINTFQQIMLFVLIMMETCFREEVSYCGREETAKRWDEKTDYLLAQGFCT
jgi:Trk-type K+ transport system membrane component